VIDVPVTFAFTAGLVATVNPCGFPMLPAYLSYFIGLDEPDSTVATRVPRALAAAGSVAVGFMAVFVALGIPINAGMTWIPRAVPWASIAIGVVLVVLGAAMLAGWRLTATLPHLDRGGQRRDFGSMALFGVSYAIASLSCTIPSFLVVVAGTTRRANLASGILAFVAYAVGMALVLMVLSVALAVARDSLVHHLRRALPYVDRVAGALLVIVGSYLVYYWVFNLARDPSETVGTSPISRVGTLTSDATRWLNEGGLELGALLAGIVVAAAAWARWRPGRG
jgi:cytochrome c-type biogenesis protein